ncbi:amino acid permease [Rhodococcus sp. G-MC3]|uniref:amino acid permease n=1 Tax=Rhodococcus sp. G-MC3 TaxID=3046209 RepID=UPI0024BBA5C9|nr:amino acid permease [Rhodococcus sp. G-MC3]MDJ0395826.1 amino acid permease [Rhodococcus sp. G-MC3]
MDISTPHRPPRLLDSLRARKSVEAIVARNEHDSEHGLKRSMGLLHLTALSIGASLGTGIFVILGEATPKAGPAVILAFVLAALTALFSALSYAELAGSIPVSGSSYSYTYATMGEMFAWVCGWCLMLEYGVSVAAVAVGWGEYINELLQGMFGVSLPAAISASPGAGGIVNVPSILIVLLAAAMLVRGASESALVNTAMVALKIVVLLFFCVIAFTAFRAGNLAPFAPLGAAGVTAAASQVFFAYIGFDAASTAGDEAKNPKKDLPRAIMLSLLIVTVIYCLVAVAAIGAMPWQDIAGDGAALATIVESVTSSTWPAVLLSAGAVIAIASVVLAVMYGQTRILYSMSLDGLVPPIFSKVSRKTRVPVSNIVIVGVLVSLLAGFVPLGELADATSIGALFAFALVNIAVILLRRRHPNLERGFKTALFPLFPILGVGFCILLLAGLGSSTWMAFLVWMALGMVVYFGYGIRHSGLRREQGKVEA